MNGGRCLLGRSGRRWIEPGRLTMSRQAFDEDLKRYFEAIGRYPLLSKADEQRLRERSEPDSDASTALANGASDDERPVLERRVAEGEATELVHLLEPSTRRVDREAVSVLRRPRASISSKTGTSASSAPSTTSTRTRASFNLHGISGSASRSAAASFAGAGCASPKTRRASSDRCSTLATARSGPRATAETVDEIADHVHLSPARRRSSSPVSARTPSRSTGQSETKAARATPTSWQTTHVARRRGARFLISRGLARSVARARPTSRIAALRTRRRPAHDPRRGGLANRRRPIACRTDRR